MLQVRKEYIKFGLAKWGLLFVERGVKIAVVERVVGPTDSVYVPIVGHTYYLCVLDCSQQALLRIQVG